MARISQLIAVVGGVSQEADGALTALHALAKRDELMAGHQKTYRPRSEDGVQFPAQSQRVRLTADEVLTQAQQLLTRKWDLGLTLDTANAAARADVHVPGQAAALLMRVPVGHLLYLEKELEKLHGLVASLPALDQEKDWSREGTEPGQHKSAAVEQVKTEKIPYNWGRKNGSANFQEQVDVLTRDEVIGTTTTVTFSGKIHPKRKAVLLERLSTLRNAVKMAREEANSAHAEDQKEGPAIFGWLLRD